MRVSSPCVSSDTQCGIKGGPSDEVRSILYFRRGNAWDDAGRRPEALTDYAEVILTDADDILEDWAHALR